jgi:nucleoside phosphorylase
MEEGVAQYSIGWIAPLPLELTAAKAMLDEDHGDIHVGGYIYHGGRIGNHNVVMAVQPKMGTDAASDLAARVRAAFRNIEYFVVVGIGGGVPSYGPAGAQHHIVFGDVVVSYPKGSYGGVVRYDFGAWTAKDQLEFRGHTNSPPDSLLAAVNALQTMHLMKCGTKIPAYLQEMRLNIHIDERKRFEDQGAAYDRLFQKDYLHPKEFAKEDCETCCELLESELRQHRGNGAERQQDTPNIHYGNIASSNQLQISAAKRDQLHKEYGVICFEMEGAGVISNHPCLVIRGICDYSDSHKNKRWQPYAAATAAAYTKELLGILPANKFARSHSAGKVAVEYKELAQERTEEQRC